MSTLFRLIFLVPLGYVAAVVAAALFIVFGAFAYPPADFAEFFIAPVVAVILVVGIASFVPAAIAITVSEIFRLRSVFYFLLVGGAVGFLAYHLSGFAVAIVVFDDHPVAYPAAGFVAGFVYWLIAGRGAGLPDLDRSAGR